MWTCYQFFLAILMVATGSINTIAAKWADLTESKGADGKVKHFNHPFFQALLMFVGEFSCYIVFKILFAVYKSKKDGREDVKQLTKGNRQFNPLLLFIPAICDLTATCHMFVALNLTYASSYQMFRGAVIIFVSILSIIFLRRRLNWREWLGIFTLICGLTLIGVADFLTKRPGGHSNFEILLGDALVILGQVFAAIQMVVQEKFVSGMNIPPLQAVGWEGMFGLLVSTFILVVFYFIPAVYPFSSGQGDRLEDAIDALVQMGNNWVLLLALTLLVISIAFFNFAGISVTKELSAVTRMVLDSLRTIVIWVFSITVFDQLFHWLQVVGFIFLVTGMCLYNNIIRIDRVCTKKDKDQIEGDGDGKQGETATSAT